MVVLFYYYYYFFYRKLFNKMQFMTGEPWDRTWVHANLCFLTKLERIRCYELLQKMPLCLGAEAEHTASRNCAAASITTWCFCVWQPSLEAKQRGGCERLAGEWWLAFLWQFIWMSVGVHLDKGSVMIEQLQEGRKSWPTVTVGFFHLAR